MTEMSLSEFANRQKPEKVKRGIPPLGIMVIGVIILASGSFAAGVQYQKGKTSSTTIKTASSQSNDSIGGFGGGFRHSNHTFGIVSSVSNSSITVQTRNDTSKTYTITSSTTVTSGGQPASVSDIQSGDMVVLTLDSSNKQNATSISLNPSFGSGPSMMNDGQGSSQTPPSTSGV